MEFDSRGAFLLALLLGTALTFPISFILIMWYRRAVSKFMKARTSSSWNEPSSIAVSTAASDIVPSSKPAAPVSDHVFSHLTEEPGGQALYDSIKSAKRRAVVNYLVAGICYAFVMALIYSSGADGGFDPVRIVLLIVIFAFPLVLTINIIATTNWRAKLFTAAIYFFILAAASVFTRVVYPRTNLLIIAGLFLLMNLPGAIFLQIFLMLKIRAVGPLVLIFMVLIVLGAQFMAALVASDDRLLGFMIAAGESVGLDEGGTLLGLFVLCVILLTPFGWLVLRWIGRRYEQKKISDQSITIDAVWLGFGIITSSGLASGGFLQGLLGLVPFLVYRLVLRLGFALSGTPVDGKNLLVLRVFSLGKKSEKLFRPLVTNWRYAGCVRLIAGTDLVASTIEPHEFLDFVSGKLSRRFIDGAEAFNLRLSETDDAADWDGRFRVTDFLCYDNTWKLALPRLVRDSDVVLMDLRGFSSRNEGCIFEIRELINIAPLERVVFVIDDKTDKRFLLENVNEAWRSMTPTSPNRFSSPAQFPLFRFADSSGGELWRLLLTLCAAAEKK